jgi:hypothetical protein
MTDKYCWELVEADEQQLIVRVRERWEQEIAAKREWLERKKDEEEQHGSN